MQPGERCIKAGLKGACCLLIASSVMPQRMKHKDQCADAVPECILCNAHFREAHPAFPGGALLWANYFLVPPHKRRRAGAQALVDVGTPGQPDLSRPKGLLCDICNRCLPSFRDNYWKFPATKVSTNKALRSEFLEVRLQYVELLRLKQLQGPADGPATVCSCIDSQWRHPPL